MSPLASVASSGFTALHQQEWVAKKSPLSSAQFTQPMPPSHPAATAQLHGDRALKDPHSSALPGLRRTASQANLQSSAPRKKMIRTQPQAQQSPQPLAVAVQRADLARSQLRAGGNILEVSANTGFTAEGDLLTLARLTIHERGSETAWGELNRGGNAADIAKKYGLYGRQSRIELEYKTLNSGSSICAGGAIRKGFSLEQVRKQFGIQTPEGIARMRELFAYQRLQRAKNSAGEKT